MSDTETASYSSENLCHSGVCVVPRRAPDQCSSIIKYLIEMLFAVRICVARKCYRVTVEVFCTSILPFSSLFPSTSLTLALTRWNICCTQPLGAGAWSTYVIIRRSNELQFTNFIQKNRGVCVCAHGCVTFRSLLKEIDRH